MPFEPIRGEYLVPVIADPPPGPAIPAAPGQTHRVGVGRPEEGLGRGGAPVDQQLVARVVHEAESPDVHGLRVLGAHDVAEAQVQTEAPQRTQASGQPVDLHVPFHRLLTQATRRLARGVEAVGQVGHGMPEALRDGREVPLVLGDQGRVGLRAEVLGKVEGSDGHWAHVSGSDLHATRTSTTTPAFTTPDCAGSGYGQPFWGTTGVLRQAPRCAID
jgi:hypothetical protein